MEKHEEKTTAIKKSKIMKNNKEKNKVKHKHRIMKKESKK